MRIGVVKEIKPDESRVALTTAGVVELRRRGHEVLVESGAGSGSAMEDAEYEAAGATITDVDTVWNDAEMVLKVKEPLDGEYQRLSPGQILFTYLHLAALVPGGRLLPDEAPRRPRPPDGRRAGRAAGEGARPGRRDRRLQRRADRAGHAGRRDRVRAQRRPHARARREPRPHRAPADVGPPRDRRGAAGRRHGDRRRARPRGQGAAPGDAGHAGHDE